MSDTLKRDALDYHRYPTPGKISVTPTKAMVTQRDLGLAYSPGVAEACLAIVDDPREAGNLTARNNLVAVITNGTAVLGLGNIGALAGKPVMEGKGCLFKKFAGIDVFDIELDELDPDKLIDTIARMEPTFGGINLEDIKAPECFYIETKLRERMKIPVFHDDQHGTAIVAAAAILNGLKHVRQGHHRGQARCLGRGRRRAGLPGSDRQPRAADAQHLRVRHRRASSTSGRKEQMDPNKARYAQADVGAQAGRHHRRGRHLPRPVGRRRAQARDGEAMARAPIILAMANPTPEILPEDALAVRPDAILGTGRSDYPNQVNNVLCFPFIFRGALDVGATTINEEMKLAAVRAIAELAHAEIPGRRGPGLRAGGLRFGADYLIPKPFDPRLIEVVAPAVAQAAMDSGVASRPITDMPAYRQRLSQFVYQSGARDAAGIRGRQALSRRRASGLAEGEDERVLRAAQVVVDEGLALPLLVGRAGVIAERIAQYRPAPEGRPRLASSSTCSTPRCTAVRRRRLLPDRRGAMASRKRWRAPRCAAAAPCWGRCWSAKARPTPCCAAPSAGFADHLGYVADVIGLRDGVQTFAAMKMLMLPERQLFICDTHVNVDPERRADRRDHLARGRRDVRRFGITPRVALLSHSSFGSSDAPGAREDAPGAGAGPLARPDVGGRRRDARRRGAVEGDPRPGVPRLRPDRRSQPAHHAQCRCRQYLVQLAAHGCRERHHCRRILLGLAQAVHILTPSSTVRRIVNMTALAAADVGATQRTEPQMAV